MAEKRDVWVVPAGLGWRVRREGEPALDPVYPSKAEAMEAGRQLAKAEHVELIWVGLDGRIQGRDSYGGDPERRPG